MNRCFHCTNVFSIIFFDIDHFKKINDEYGHDIGDAVLQEYVSLVKKYIPPGNLFGRWSGEEFIIILKNHTLQEASQFAKDLQNIIENHTFSHVDHITSSFGVSTYGENDTPLLLMKHVDEALYMAKKNGRNTVQTL